MTWQISYEALATPEGATELLMRMALKWGVMRIRDDQEVLLIGMKMDNGLITDPGSTFVTDRMHEQALMISECTFDDTNPVDIVDALILRVNEATCNI